VEHQEPHLRAVEPEELVVVEQVSQVVHLQRQQAVQLILVVAVVEKDVLV
jgi:acyl-coenzyme A thioesterase PaaI-like protein